MKVTFDLFRSDKEMGLIIIPETEFEKDFMFRLSQNTKVIGEYAYPLHSFSIGLNIKMPSEET